MRHVQNVTWLKLYLPKEKWSLNKTLILFKVLVLTFSVFIPRWFYSSKNFQNFTFDIVRNCNVVSLNIFHVVKSLWMPSMSSNLFECLPRRQVSFSALHVMKFSVCLQCHQIYLNAYNVIKSLWMLSTSSSIFECLPRYEIFWVHSMSSILCEWLLRHQIFLNAFHIMKFC